MMIQDRLAVRTFEPHFLTATREWAELLHRAGLDVRFETFDGGHDELWWRRQFVDGLGDR
jgi:enterochelin esterase-like enzyme